MKKLFTLLHCFLFLNFAQTQEIHKIDSISMEICASIKSNAGLPDSSLVYLIIEKHFAPYLAKAHAEHQDSLLKHISLRAEKLCPEFNALSYRLSEENGDWVLLTEKPESVLSDSLCSKFFDIQRYFYLEPNGDKVALELKDGYWVDNFLDGTYSKLKLIDQGNCEFEIQFLKSNNSLRNKFSKVGDRYRYQILDFEENKYHMSVEVPEQNQYYKFILYISE